MKKLAAVGAAVVVGLGLSVTPAYAWPVTTNFTSKWLDKCLDFRADMGVYLTGCNKGAYQNWHWATQVDHTALRQQATGLCLTLRDGDLAMKPCAAADAAAYWIINVGSGEPVLIKNEVSGKCLAVNVFTIVVTATCTGGDSQRWGHTVV